ncbi:MAG TPA: hypothetical protein ENI23_04505 [bacterium]|nr:hypothetical protein [bacterium]
MKPKKWKVTELKRFSKILLQISQYDFDIGEYVIVGSISIEEEDLESRESWLKVIEMMNQELSQKNS